MNSHIPLSREEQTLLAGEVSGKFSKLTGLSSKAILGMNVSPGIQERFAGAGIRTVQDAQNAVFSANVRGLGVQAQGQEDVYGSFQSGSEALIKKIQGYNPTKGNFDFQGAFATKQAMTQHREFLVGPKNVELVQFGAGGPAHALDDPDYYASRKIAIDPYDLRPQTNRAMAASAASNAAFEQTVKNQFASAQPTHIRLRVPGTGQTNVTTYEKYSGIAPSVNISGQVQAARMLGMSEQQIQSTIVSPQEVSIMGSVSRVSYETKRYAMHRIPSFDRAGQATPILQGNIDYSRKPNMLGTGHYNKLAMSVRQELGGVNLQANSLSGHSILGSGAAAAQPGLPQGAYDHIYRLEQNRFRTREINPDVITSVYDRVGRQSATAGPIHGPSPAPVQGPTLPGVGVRHHAVDKNLLGGNVTELEAQWDKERAPAPLPFAKGHLSTRITSSGATVHSIVHPVQDPWGTQSDEDANVRSAKFQFRGAAQVNSDLSAEINRGVAAGQKNIVQMYYDNLKTTGSMSAVSLGGTPSVTPRQPEVAPFGAYSDQPPGVTEQGPTNFGNYGPGPDHNAISGKAMKRLFQNFKEFDQEYFGWGPKKLNSEGYQGVGMDMWRSDMRPGRRAKFDKLYSQALLGKEVPFDEIEKNIRDKHGNSLITDSYKDRVLDRYGGKWPGYDNKHPGPAPAALQKFDTPEEAKAAMNDKLNYEEEAKKIKTPARETEDFIAKRNDESTQNVRSKSTSPNASSTPEAPVNISSEQSSGEPSASASDAALWRDTDRVTAVAARRPSTYSGDPVPADTTQMWNLHDAKVGGVKQSKRLETADAYGPQSATETPTFAAFTPARRQIVEQEFRSYAHAMSTTTANTSMALESSAAALGGVVRGGAIFNQKTGEQILSQDQGKTAVKWAQSAMTSAASGFDKGTADETLASVEKKVGAHLEKQYSKAISKAENIGEQQTALTLKRVAKGMTRSAVNALSTTMGTGANALEVGRFRDMEFNNVRLGGNVAAIEAAMEGSPSFKGIIDRDYGGSADRAARAPAGTIGDVEGGAMSFGGGGGRGGGGGATPSASKGMWGGSLGKLMYASYIGKRMWTMTAAPQLEKAAEYGKYMGSYAGLAAQEGVDLMSSDAGYMARSGETARFWQKGAYEQFGGFKDLGYGIAGGSGAVARAGAGFGISLGAVAAGGVSTATGAALAEMGGIAGVGGAAMVSAGTVMIAAGAAITVGIIGMEAYNWATGDNQTYGKLISEVVNDFVLTDALNNFEEGQGLSKDEIRHSRGFQDLSIDKNREDYMRSIGISNEDLYGQMSPKNEAIARMQDAPGAVRNLEQLGAKVGAIQGEEAPSAATLKAVQAYSTMMGGVGGREEFLQDFTQAAARKGVALPDAMAEAGAIAASMGIYAGDAVANTNVMSSWMDRTRADDQKAVMSSAVTTSVAGMLAPYVGPQAALELAQGYQTTGQAAGTMSILGAFAQQGVDSRTVAYYASVDSMEGRTAPVSLAEAAKAYALEVGNKQAGIAGAMIAPLKRAGFSDTEAMYGARTFGIDTSSKAASFATLAGALEADGPMTEAEATIAALSGAMTTPAQAAQIGGVSQRFETAGYSGASVMGNLATSGFNAQELNFVNSLASGNLKAASWATYEGISGSGKGPMAPMSSRLFNQAGQPIYKTDFGSFLEMGAGQAGLGNPFAISGLQHMSSSSVQQLQSGQYSQGDLMGFASEFFGSTDQSAMSAWVTGGAQGRTMDHNAKMAGFSLAGIGVALQGIQQQRQHLWGQDDGGAFDAPAAGSMWAIQDSMTQARHSATMAGFSANLKRMKMSHGFDIERDVLGEERMGVTQDYQQWQAGFSRDTSLLKRGWKQEDYQYNDQMKDLNFGWAMEDVDEAIRFSGGRQRRTLETKKDRMVMSQNLEGEHTDVVRKRQDEMWAREDERFEKSSDYMDHLHDLDRRNFDMNIKQRDELYVLDRENLKRQISEYKTMYKLQRQMEEKQREYQASQIDLQERSLGIQAAAAQEQKTYNEEMLKVSTFYEETAGFAGEISKWDPTITFGQLQLLIEVAGDNRTASNIERFAAAMEIISKTPPPKTGSGGSGGSDGVVTTPKTVAGWKTLQQQKLERLLTDGNLGGYGS